MKHYKPFTEAVGQLLLLCREMKGETLRQVAAKTGLSNGFISQIECGHALPGLGAAVVLCDHYGIKLERLAVIVREHGLGGAE